MSVSEREQTKFVHRERRMAIMNEVHDITFINLFFILIFLLLRLVQKL